MEAWSKKTGLPKTQGGQNGAPLIRVVDVEGGRPLMVTETGSVSNAYINVPPLWASGTGQPNVRGYLKTTGLWELNKPLSTHQELSGRIFFADDIDNGPESFHATFVAGIIGASGVGYSAYYKGAAYQTSIRVWNKFGNYSEITGLPLSLVKDMRVSNHSYGGVNGWYLQDFGTGTTFKSWNGDVAVSTLEDHKFGLYSSDSSATDQAAILQPYHLIVNTAGNDRDDSDTAATFQVLRQEPVDTGTGTELCEIYQGSHAWFANYGTQRILIMDTANGPRWAPVTQIISYEPDASEVEPSEGSVCGGKGSGHRVIFVQGTVFLPFPVDQPPYTATPYFQSQDGNGVGFDTIPGGFSVAKNVLTVGAMSGYNEWESDSVAAYSGWGPTDDGRIKPDVMALGGDLETELEGLGNLSSTDYTPLALTLDGKPRAMTGTSFAAPAVAGAVTLLSEYHEKLRGGKEPLRASTLKALLIHTARDLHPPGPDYQSGWGVADIAAASEIIRQNSGRVHIKEVLVQDYGAPVFYSFLAKRGYYNPTAEPVKVTIAWSDPPGKIQPDQLDPPGTAPGWRVLTNDIDLRLDRFNPSATVYPWKLDPADPWAWATRGDNNRDNVEQIIINDLKINSSSSPNEVITLSVSKKNGTMLSGGSQWVSIIITGVQNWPSDTLGSFNPNSIGYYRPSATQLAAQMSFSSVAGGYYRIQYQPYGSPAGTWADASPLLYGTTHNLLAQSNVVYVPNSTTTLSWRVVSVSPNPFGLP